MSQVPYTEEMQKRFQTIEGGAFGVVGSKEVLSVNGSALSPNVLLSQIATVGAETRTLAAPAADGQLKIITMTVNGGNATIALTNFSTGTTLTFSAVGQSAILMSAGGLWVRLAGSAVVT